MVLCDLPYGTTRNKWDTVIPFDRIWRQYDRVLKENGCVVLFGCEPFTSFLITSNIEDFKYKITWKKDACTNFLNAKRQPLRQIEDICVFYKEQPIYNPQFKIGKPYKQMSGVPNGNYDVAHCKRVETVNDGKRYPSDFVEFPKVKKTLHPTQKPVALLEYLVKTYTNEGDTVLDNCMGSGSTGVACINTNRRFIGIELDENYFNIAKERIEKRHNEIMA
jgi:site-specific DNA-methyltransferase (adenine-specific)